MVIAGHTVAVIRSYNFGSQVFIAGHTVAVIRSFNFGFFSLGGHRRSHCLQDLQHRGRIVCGSCQSEERKEHQSELLMQRRRLVKSGSLLTV